MGRGGEGRERKTTSGGSVDGCVVNVVSIWDGLGKEEKGGR